MTTQEFFHLPEAVLQAAVSRLVAEDPDERAAALAGLVTEHPEHEPGLRALCETLEHAGNVLANTLAARTAGELPRLDGYRVVRVLGEGAFGIVYLCEQHEPVQRQVAVKVLRPGAGDRGTLARFDAERQFLARLSHPAIAQIFDAGLLADGRPWFVMEHVPGVPIAAYCDRAHLSIETRLQLFVRLCHGVQHAHEQGIVHRDLKPANVLVVETDGEPQPKIIDFGIARVLQPTAEQAEVRTETGRVVGTPGYMSPEQSAGRPDEVDARSDVFSLGVLLYELLTGELPWGKHPASTDSEPPRPSQRIGSDVRCTTVAEQRRSRPRQLVSRLRGDLDWIVLKALSRERERRYATAAELAAEIVRHLRGEPVQAGPPSFSYRLRKLVRRRRTALSAAAVVAVTAASASLLIHDSRSEALARGNDAATAVASLLARANDFEVTSAPQSEHVRSALAREAAHFYEQFLGESPNDPTLLEGHARSLATLAQVHLLLGQFPEAEKTAREAVADVEPLVAADPDAIGPCGALGVARWFLGRALQATGRAPQARQQLESALDLLSRCYAEAPAQNAAQLAGVCRELVALLDPATDGDRALDLLARGRDVQQWLVQHQPESVNHLEGLVEIDVVRSLVQARAGDLGAAMAALEPSENLIDTRPDIGPSTVARVHAVAAELLARDGKDQQAIERLEQAVAAARAWVDREPNREHPATMLAKLLAQLASWQDASGLEVARVTTHRAAVAAAEARLVRASADPTATLSLIVSLDSLARALLREGASAYAEAERCARRAVALVGTADEHRADVLQQRVRWLALGTLGIVGDELRLPDAEATWQQAEGAIRGWPDGNDLDVQYAAYYVDVALRIANRRIAAGHAEAAHAIVDEVVRVVDQVRAVAPDIEIDAAGALCLSAVLAAQRHELEFAATEAERAHEIEDNWRGWLAASRAMHAVCRAAEPGSPYPERAIQVHERAVEELGRVAAERPEDAAIIGALAQTRVRLALARHAAGKPFDPNIVRQALDTLAAWCDRMHAWDWDEPLRVAGTDLLHR